MAAADVKDNAELFQTLDRLVGAWCDRRSLKALRAILPGYPLTSPLTDGWGALLTSLQDVRALAGNEVTDAERRIVDECIRVVDQAVHRSLGH
jgi:hypothetical protein